MIEFLSDEGVKRKSAGQYYITSTYEDT